MAAKSAIGIRREAAIRRLNELLGDDFVLPMQGKDPDLLHAVQLEAIADFLAARQQSPAFVFEPVAVTIASTELAPNGVEHHSDPTPRGKGRGKGKRS